MSFNTQNTRALKTLNIVILFAIAFGLRLYYINHTIIDTPVRADARDYYSYAFNMKNHHVYSRTWPSNVTPKPDALRSPGYPAFISPFVTFPPTASMVWTITFWQALLDTLTVLLTFFLARQFFGIKLASFTALLTALSPHLISATSYLLTETLFSFLMTASMLAIVIAIRKNSNIIFLLAGILIALTSLTRPTIQYFIAPLAICLFIARGYLNLNKNVWISLILGFALVSIPWVARNMSALGASSDPTLTINTLHHGIYPDFMFQSDPATKGIPYRFDPNSPEISSSVHASVDEIIRRFRTEPLRHLKWYLIDKPVTFLSWNIVAGLGDVFIYPIVQSPYLDNPVFKSLHRLMYWLHWPLIILSIAACLAAWIPQKILNIDLDKLIPIRILSLLVLYFLAVHVVGAPFPRYSIPLRPINYILASWSLALLIRFISNKGDASVEQP
ncbi:MAG: glycosyltransferase family 39 protein [Pseudomonadales bacterium]|nr:glycosyltransferase family 39 protein [Pseudomonadales bacterium]